MSPEDRFVISSHRYLLGHFSKLKCVCLINTYLLLSSRDLQNSSLKEGENIRENWRKVKIGFRVIIKN